MSNATLRSSSNGSGGGGSGAAVAGITAAGATAADTTVAWRPALDRLKRHPFQQLQLAGREKFHTAMLAHVLSHPRIGPAVFEEIAGRAAPGPLRGICEHDSMDLIVVSAGGEVGDPWHAVIEMKYATRLHGQQLKKYAEKIRRRRQEVAPARLLVSLFAPRSDDEIAGTGFERVDLFGGVLAAVRSRVAQLGDADEDGLIRLWVRYLEDVAVQREALVALGTDEALEFGAALAVTKLKGLFEEQRLLPTRMALEEQMTGGSGRKSVPLVVAGNTRGNPLLETNFFPVSGVNVKYGLQWQSGNLKLFVSFEDRNCPCESERGKTLKALADRLREVTRGRVDWPDDAGPWVLNKTGKFRSITVMRWDPWGDVRARPREFVVLAEALRDDDVCRSAVVRLIERARVAG